MPSSERAEHFVTLFDVKFLPIGMCLHASLVEHASPFHLWIVCMDDAVEAQLRKLDLPHVSLIPLRDAETAALLQAKTDRTPREYCWTITPFVHEFVFDRAPGVDRVTYLDADLFFFNSPQLLLVEFEESGKHVLITDHAYAPEYDQTATSGRFCVQFLTVRRTTPGLAVMRWWQDRCLEWCYQRFEDGKFGDQKYLDDWPRRFANEAHVLRQTARTLAPWNVRRAHQMHGEQLVPVFYHFQGLRIIARDTVLLHSMYKIGAVGERYYAQYVDALRRMIRVLTAAGLGIRPIHDGPESWMLLRRIKRRLRGTAYARLTNS